MLPALVLWVLFTICCVALYRGKLRVEQLEAQARTAAAEVSELEHRLASLFERTPVGYVDIDNEGRIQRVNGAECELRGVDSDELVGKLIWDLEPEESRQRSREAFHRLVVGDFEPEPIRRDYHRSDGSRATVEVHSSCRRDQQGHVIGVRNTSVNAGAAVQANEEAIHKSQQLQAVFTALPDAYFHLDETGIVLDYTPAPHFDRPPEEIVGRAFRNVVPPAARDLVEHTLASVQQTHSDATVEYQGERDGQGRQLEARFVPINPAETAVLVRDITERINANKKIKQYAQQLREKNEELADALVLAREATNDRDQFLASVSHELRSPLTGLIGMSELLLDTELDRDQRDYAQTLRYSADRLLSVINDVLGIWQAGAGKLTLENKEFNVRKAVQDAISPLFVQAQTKGLSLNTLIDREVPDVLVGDAGRLRQILFNLTENAVKFTQHGAVDVRVAFAGEMDDTCTLRFTVRDTGAGISSDQLARIFDGFKKPDDPMTRELVGSGLSLTIAKQLIEMMGGEIAVESEVERGTVFRFTVVLQKHEQAPQREAQRFPSLSGLRVLIVEAGDANRASVRHNLELWGCSCKELTDANQVPLTLRSALSDGHPFHLTLVEIDGPTEGGFSIGMTVKSDPGIGDTIIVGMTSAPYRLDGPTLHAAGFSGCVRLPVRPRELHETVVHAVQESRWSAVGATGIGRIQMVSSGSGVQETPNGAPCRILVAEDDPVCQRILLRQIRGLGCQVDGVLDGRRAVRAFAKQHYDLILMDVRMPVMDGLDAAAAIREMEESDRHVPIVAVTANAMPSDRERCLAAGMDEYVVKPVDLNTLRTVIERRMAPECRRVSTELTSHTCS